MLRSDEPSRFLVDVPSDVGTAVADARAQGVVSLINAQLEKLDSLTSLPTGWRESFLAAARAEATQSLALLGECRRVSGALVAAGIPAIWLKGVAIAQWLYPSPGLRDAADADLLFASHFDAMRATAILAPLGYVLPNPHIAGDLVVNELLAVSSTGRELDMHWALGNGPLYAHRLRWDELRADAISLPMLGEGALGLSPVHAFLHACMHLAVNQLVGQGNRLRWLYDLHLIAKRFDHADWQRLVALAIERGLADTCRMAIERLQAVLGSPVPTDVVRDLERAATREPVRCRRLDAWHYRQWSDWRTLPTLEQRLRWARQLLFPDMAHLYVRYGNDGAGVVRVIYRRLFDGWKRLRRYARSDAGRL